MLKIIYGVAGVGKTALLNDLIKESLSNNRKVMLLVPEQFSFETEANMLDELTDGSFFNLQVLNFSRLCDKIFNYFGSDFNEELSNCKKSILLMKSVLAVKDSLKIYKKNNLSQSFISNLSSTITEIKNSALKPGFYNLMNIENDNDILSEKIHDIDLIYTYFSAFTGEYSPDATEKIVLATELLKQNDTHFFDETDIYIDVFSGFTKVQYDMLKIIFLKTENIIVSLCCDKVSAHKVNDKYSLFSPIYSCAKNLIDIAKSQGVKIATPKKIEKITRFENQQLIDLENNFLRDEVIKSENINQHIFINKFDDVYKEAEYVSAKINDLIKTENYRYKDFIIITRNLNDNYDIYKNAFNKYEIPYFMDVKEAITHKPIFTFVFSLFNVINYGFRTEDILTILKTGAFGIDYDLISTLENYCYIWNIEKSTWKTDFIFNPDGLSGEISQQGKEKLTQINQIRATVINPIIEFTQKVKENFNAKHICQCIYELLNKIGCYENIKKREELFSDIIENNESLKVYNRFLQLLDDIALTLDDTKVDLKTFGQILSVASTHCDLGKIPNAIDQVIIGQADRIRADGRKCCFIVGLNQGIFPPENFNFGIFNSKEKEKLSNNGLKISEDDFYYSSMEDFYAYCAITAPKSELFLSYSLADRSFGKLFPSPYINRITEIFPNVKINNILQDDNYILAQNEKSLISLFASTLNENHIVSQTLKQAVILDEKTSKILEQVENGVKIKPIIINDKEVIKKLFGNNLRVSASKIEKFNVCRFAYFLEYAMKIKKLTKAEITPLESGTIIHYVLSEFISQRTKQDIIGIKKEQIKKDIKKLTYDYCEDNICKIDELSKKQQSIINRIVNALCEIIEIISKEFEQSQFTPTDFEMEIGINGEIKPVVLQSIDGENVMVEGKVDRVDCYEKNGIKYIRVIDYKSGSKDFKLSDVYYGLNMQMLIYLFSIWKNGKEKYGDISPAGVLYFPAKKDIINVNKIIKEQSEDNIIKSYKMNGLIIDDNDVIAAMEKDISGVFIPAQLTSKGELSNKSSVASLEQLGKLRNYVENQIVKMADLIYAGDFDYRVCKSENSSPCEYCTYYKICLNEDEENSMIMDKIEKKEFFDLIDDEKALKD